MKTKWQTRHRKRALFLFLCECFYFIQTLNSYENPFFFCCQPKSFKYSFSLVLSRSCIVYKHCFYRFIRVCVYAMLYICYNTKRARKLLSLYLLHHSYWIKQFFMCLRLFKWSVTKWKQSTCIVYSNSVRTHTRLLTRSHSVSLFSLCRLS